MAGRVQYATTIGYFEEGDDHTGSYAVDDPTPPKGNGWRMVGSTISAERYGQQVILWFWQRRPNKLRAQ